MKCYYKRQKGVFVLLSGLMDLGETFEETVVSEVLEETNFNVTSLELKQVFSGKEFNYKVDNGDEFYSETAVFVANSFKGSSTSNLSESLGIAFYSLDAVTK